MSWSLQTGPVTNTFTKTGRRTTLDLPGGLYYVYPMKKGKKESTKSNPGQDKAASAAAKPTQATPTAAPPAHVVPNPGFMAPAVEKRFAQGLLTLIDGDTT